MINAERTGFWGKHYSLTAEDGTPVTTWDISNWVSGGGFTLDGQGYTVRSSGWAGNKFTMLDGGGAVVAEAERAGHKQWKVRAGGRSYEFRRKSWLSWDQDLVDGDRVVGSVKRTSNWTGRLSADLPGLPLPVQVFVVGIMITQWTSAAAGGGA
ncbi:MAG TPA: hypothetical protein VN408_26665 [Actinoplanes sp.]|nr:hypothetical protein [Actinoplanes sp.]